MASLGNAETQLCDADGVARLIAELSAQIAESVAPGPSLGLIGIHRRGVVLARRIAAELAPKLGIEVPVGALDITLYRDDLDRGTRWPVLNATEVPFPVEGAEIILVDDVLFTGRTVRAALNAICDLGRPARVRLAVAVDRDWREIPVQPDFVGLSLRTARDQRVLVRLRPVDTEDKIVRVDPS